MGLRDLQLGLTYESSGENNLIDEFYIPVLEKSVKYCRIAGFFSSSSLVVAAKGIEGLINNNGKMFLLISPELSEEDYKTIKATNEVNENMEMFRNLDFQSVKDENLEALAWLLDNNRLEIKIVVGKKSRNSLFHQKIGILFDDKGNIVSFSGSINESAQAWLNNIEEFKVFRSWVEGQIDFVNADLERFNDYWKNNKKDIADVYDIPKSIRENIVKLKPKNIYDLNIMRRYCKDKKFEMNKLSLFPHQQKAVDKWLGNNCNLLMEMATGTGKTRTAIGCTLVKMKKLKKNERLFIIVATPQNTLSRQWKTDIEELEIAFDKSLIIDGSNKNWKKELEITMLDLDDGKIKNAIIFTTHATASNDKFINIIKENKYNSKILFICDEVHAIGSEKQKNALLEEYDFRIGLSATPERMFDEEGTGIIKDYFGGESFEFTIADALNNINPVTGKPFLNHYDYVPIFVYLTEKEENAYKRYTKQVITIRNQRDVDWNKLQIVLDKRADILKNAEEKYKAFSELLDRLNPATIKDTILFVSDNQIKKAFQIMDEKSIMRAKITEKESATKVVNDEGETERQNLISEFKNSEIQILVGIKCLDEGIDIPNARVGILMSNSTNPREYVQRIGRVIRQAPKKEKSIIYDFVATPSEPDTLGIADKEAKRVQQIAANAENYEAVYELFRERGIDLNADKQED